MASTTAKNYEDVEGMTKRQRLWDSLNYSYGKKGEKLAEEYDKARATADRQLIGRGMQRSSYGAQTLANMDKQKIDALDDNQSAMIADYESRLQDIEAQELAQSNWERQFAEGQRQFNEGQNFQRSENALNRAFQSGESALNRAFQTSERQATQGWQSGENALNRSFQTSEREATQGWQSGENALNRAFQTSEREAQQNWQSGENALNREENRYQFDTNLNFQRERAAVGDQQWQQNFAEGQRQFNEQMGLNRDQFNWQKEQAAAKASSGRSGSSSTSKKNPWDVMGITEAEYKKLLNGGSNPINDQGFEDKYGLLGNQTGQTTEPTQLYKDYTETRRTGSYAPFAAGWQQARENAKKK